MINNLSLPTELFNYNINLTLCSQSDKSDKSDKFDMLIIEFEYLGIVFESTITQTNLKSGLVNLSKLKNIIDANSKQTQPNFIIFVESDIDIKTNSKHIILCVSFSNEYIEFDEKIILFEKKIIMKEQTDNLKLKLIVMEQNEKIIQMEKIITQMEKRLKLLENEQYITLPIKEINFQYNPFLSKNNHLPKNIDSLTIQEIINGNNGNRMIDKYEIGLVYNFLKNEQKFKHDIPNFLIKNGDLINDKNMIIKINIEIFGTFLFFDIKKIKNLKNPSYYDIREQKMFDNFLDFYLGNKKDFIVDEIEIICNKSVETIIKYTNYKKLLIIYDKHYNDEKIKSHCELNNIEFGYV